MGYVEENLLPDETIKAEARLHWILFAPTVILTLVFFIGPMFMGTAISAEANPGGGAMVEGLTGIIMGIVGVLMGSIIIVPALIAQIILYRTSEFALTDKRIIIKTGLIQRKTMDLKLGKVESCSVDESLLGRLLGYGNIVITGTGGASQKFKKIDKPFDFRQAVNQHI